MKQCLRRPGHSWPALSHHWSVCVWLMGLSKWLVITVTVFFQPCKFLHHSFSTNHRIIFFEIFSILLAFLSTHTYLPSPLSTTVLVPASCGAALAPVPSSPHFWQVTSWSIGLTWLAVSTQMCSHLSFPVLCQWLGPLLSMLCCSVGFSLSSVLSPVLSSPSLHFNFSFFLLLFCTIINLHQLIQKMLLPCQPLKLYSVLHLIVFKLFPNPIHLL